MLRDFTFTVPAREMTRMIHDLKPEDCEDVLEYAVVCAFHDYVVACLTEDDFWDIISGNMAEGESSEEYITTVLFKGETNEKNLS